MSWLELLNNLESGAVRAASQNESGQWQANVEVKQGILEAFKNGTNTEFAGGFVDKHNLAPQEFSTDDGVRMVPINASSSTTTGLAPIGSSTPPS